MQRRPPKEIKTLTERIRSRFESDLLADISSPDFETRIGIINMKTRALGINLNDDYITYIAEKVKTNTRQIEGIINQIHAYINLHHQLPSMNTIQGYVRNISREVLPEPITVKKVVSEVATFYKIRHTLQQSEVYAYSFTNLRLYQRFHAVL